MTVELFGRLVDRGAVEQSVLTLLKRWMHTYLLEAEVQAGRDPESIARPKSWIVVKEFEKWPEDHVPCIVVVSPGLYGTPEKNGDGYYRARWSVGVGAVVAGGNQAVTHEIAGVYAAAIRAILLQKPGMADTPLEDVSRGVGWLDESYDEIPSGDRRSLEGVQEIFFVEVDEVVNALAGPAEPEPPIDEDAPYTVVEGGAQVEVHPDHQGS